MIEPRETAPRSGRPLRALLLEDSRFDAELLRENLLRHYPFADLRHVTTEAAYLAALKDGGWDVVLSDYELPGYSGPQALRDARANDARVPFVFVSGVIGEDNAVEMLKRGATDYVSKQRLSRLPLVLERALMEVAERRGRTEAEAKLREADAMYARVVDSLHDHAVVLLDTQGRVTTWNAAARAMFGFEPEEIVGRTAEPLFTAEDRLAGVARQRMAEALAKGAASTERWMMRKDGLQMRADSVLTPVYSDARDHTGFCAIVRDVTERFRNAEALNAAKEQAERDNETKDRFLAILSHELRTPLTPIVAATHVLERVATVPERHSQLLPMIRRNVALEARLIDDLLDITAINAGKVHLAFAPTDLHQVVRRVVDMLATSIEDARLRIVLELDAPSAMVQADEARLQQVVWNLLRNAIKFTPPGGRITWRSYQPDGHLVLECEDTGAGISQETMERIFLPFEQGDEAVTGRAGGLGLGLAIARGLAAGHGGQLSVSSEGPGKGATFRLTLPTMEASAGEIVAEPLGLQDAGGAHVLLVEDNMDAAATMQEVLELFGWRVTHAATCAAALETASHGVFDVVLTDLGLPDGSGIDVGRELSSRLPVVALSGYGASPDFQRSTMAGFAGHLVKPAHPDEVHRVLLEALQARRARQAAAEELRQKSAA